MKLFANNHTYKHPWAHVTSAFWRKYPNPLATHVKQIDVYDRSLDPETGNLVINRLIQIESVLPAWVSAVGLPTTAFVCETSVVNAESKEMVVKSRNISGSSLMVVEETCTYTPHQHHPSWTNYTQEARITAFLPMFSSSVESFSLNSMHAKSKQGLEAIEILCQRVASDGLESIHSLSDTFNAFVHKLGQTATGTAAVISMLPQGGTPTIASTKGL
jgi:hypothetical protein